MQIISRENLEDYVEKLNNYFTVLGRVIGRFDGEVIKYTGDGILAVFNGVARCHFAAKCAEELMRVEINEEQPFESGIGVADGLVMIGFIGTESRLFYDVLGVNVNIATRLCTEAEGGEIIITSLVKDAARMEIDALVATLINAKGLSDPITCYRYKPLDWRCLWS